MRDSKLSKLLLHKNGATLYGLYWLLVEFLFELENNLGTFDQLRMLARSLKIPESFLLKMVTDFDLFVIEGDTFYSKGLNKRVEEIEEKRAQRMKKQARKTCSNTLKENDNIHDNNEITVFEKHTIPEETIPEQTIPEERKEEKNLENENKEISTSSSKSSSSPELEKKDCSAGEAVVVDFSKINDPWGYEPLQPVMDWEKCVEQAFKSQEWFELVGMRSHLGEEFRDNPFIVKRLFKEHVITQGNESTIRSERQAKNYFANMMQPGMKTHQLFAARLHELVLMEIKNPFEEVDSATGKRSYFGFPIPDEAPPRPNANAVWNVKQKKWKN
ncbi:MAG: hypothetical protein PHI48_09190 [Bacteroidales bacterium]|nr:hypothetical protein [Bacteroidales bacterium]